MPIGTSKSENLLYAPYPVVRLTILAIAVTMVLTLGPVFLLLIINLATSFEIVRIVDAVVIGIALFMGVPVLIGIATVKVTETGVTVLRGFRRDTLNFDEETIATVGRWAPLVVRKGNTAILVAVPWDSRKFALKAEIDRRTRKR